MRITELEKLPASILKRDAASTQGKLWQITAEQLDWVDVGIAQIRLAWDIDRAYGVGLDLIGTRLRENRRGLNDEDYRNILKVIVKKVFSRGDRETIIQVCETYDLTNIEITEDFGIRYLDGTYHLDGTWLLNGYKNYAAFKIYAEGDYALENFINKIRAAGVRADIRYALVDESGTLLVDENGFKLTDL
jgi:hypothetical protein